VAQTDEQLEALARALGTRLIERGWHVASAESCTGGWVAKTITDVAGSSAWFGWGCVTYANAAKTKLLGISEALLAEHGAVSEPVARAMAEGVRALSGAELAVAITGVAGPDGGTPAKPVGTVWVAWTSIAGTRAEHAMFVGDRHAVRRQSVDLALRGLAAELERSLA
jgi:nicotinamide-nucleotide amidase